MFLLADLRFEIVYYPKSKRPLLGRLLIHAATVEPMYTLSGSIR